MANLISRASLLAFQASYEHTCSGPVKQTILELCHGARFIALLEIHACSNPSPLFPNIVST